MDNIVKDTLTAADLSNREKNILAGRPMIHHVDHRTVKNQAMMRMNLVQETIAEMEKTINEIGATGMTMELIERYEALKNMFREIEIEEGRIALGQ